MRFIVHGSLCPGTPRVICKASHLSIFVRFSFVVDVQKGRMCMAAGISSISFVVEYTKSRSQNHPYPF